MNAVANGSSINHIPHSDLFIPKLPRRQANSLRNAPAIQLPHRRFTQRPLKGVTGYDLDESTGKFSAYLNGSCAFSLEGSYQLNYKPTIKGYVSKGRLSKLVGVKVQLFFIWVDIVEVDRSSDDLDFSVGIASAGFSVDSFEECPRCGCGLNCGDRRTEYKEVLGGGQWPSQRNRTKSGIIVVTMDSSACNLALAAAMYHLQMERNAIAVRRKAKDAA
ncbi:hypothetical protein RHSIM_Rhsim05G0137600 [Rhododendron simsii]|uniref:Uncharacterized protein n=1 Tax=Rhododendron simsii TaxID=118357 RepID=A0A834GZ05_RHOSS|nr:hypothetical protein RHSIM_Rhsim05G0137600 [Rhododendron simsii]